MPEKSKEGRKKEVSDFIHKTKESLLLLSGAFLSFEQKCKDSTTIDLIIKTLNSINDSASFFKFTIIANITEKLRDMLTLMKRGEITFENNIKHVLLEFQGLIFEILDCIAVNDKEAIATDTLNMLTEKLNSILSGKNKETSKSTILDIEFVEKEAPKPEIKKIIPAVQRKTGQKTGVFSEQTVRVDTKRLDDVMNLVGELILCKNQIDNVITKLDQKYPEDGQVAEIASNSEHLSIITTDLQLAVMKTRMQPISKVFSKFPRIVRDLSKNCKKKVTLILTGEETELDKSVIESIGDPLIHIVRNALDHGIESGEDRLAIGKPEASVLKLSAYHEGNNIIIEIEDDGKGMDVNIIKEKAISKGLINTKDLHLMTDRDIIHLIFLPGFSTKEVVTDISGRGVGMDVVKTNVVKLGGLVDIDTKLDAGTKFSIRLPITLAILQSLMVAVDNLIFAIPLASVKEIIKVPVEDIKIVNHMEVVNIRDHVMPIIKLRDQLEISSITSKESIDIKEYYTIIIGYGEKQIGIVIDRLIGQQEVVIKSLGKYLSNIDCFAGASINGEGKVVLILDVASIFSNINISRGSWV